jgi:membrane-bound acyltransferase YfiQ involved in biofilm formation
MLAVMAILQIISFGRFKDWVDSINIGWPTAVAIVIIIAELWGALSLLRIPMGFMWRFLGVSVGILVTGFWFVENAYLASSSAGQLPTSGYFGKYLNQQPGWWTLIEITILLFWIVWGAEMFKLRSNNR